MFAIKERTENKVQVALETSSFDGSVQIVGYDNNGKRRVIITLKKDGTFARNPFANLQGVKVTGAIQQIAEVST